MLEEELLIMAVLQIHLLMRAWQHFDINLMQLLKNYIR